MTSATTVVPADSTRRLLETRLATRILILDGAMGTMIQRRQFGEAEFRGVRFENHSRDLKGDNDLLVLTQPDAVVAIHEAYLEAGADIIETNTFNGTAIAQADYGLETVAYELNREAARLAKRAAREWTCRTPEQPRFVAGSIGPTNKALSISPDVNDPTFRSITFDALRDAYAQQARGLIDGGCELLLVETIFDTLNARAAIVAIQEVVDEKGVDLPLMISVTITGRSGRTLSGQTIDTFWVSIAHAKPFSVGINCALGAREMLPHLTELARVAGTYVSCHPNAGLPNAFGEYDESPAKLAGYSGNSRRAAWSICWAAAVGRRRTTSERLPRRSKGSRRAQGCDGRGGRALAFRPISPTIRLLLALESDERPSASSIAGVTKRRTDGRGKRILSGMWMVIRGFNRSTKRTTSGSSDVKSVYDGGCRLGGASLREMEYHIRQYELQQGALEIQYIEEYFGEFQRRKTASEVVRRLSNMDHQILMAEAPLPDDPSTILPVAYKVSHQLRWTKRTPSSLTSCHASETQSNFAIGKSCTAGLAARGAIGVGKGSSEP